jgi:Transmembrane domain of unknown function (DUF3566)
MAETQAKSGTTGTSIDPSEPDALSEEGAGSESSIDRTAVGRASVPGDSPAAASDSKIDNKSNGSSRDATQPAPSASAPPAIGSAAAGVATKNSPPDGGVTERRTPPAVGRGAAPVTTRPAPPGRNAGSAVAPAPTTDAQGNGAARVADAVRSARQTVSTAASRGPRRARLFVKRIDPWSVMKFSFAVSFVLFFVLVVATAVLYLTLDQMSVFTSVNKVLTDIFGSDQNVKITATSVIGAAGALGLVLVVLFTALCTLAAFIYNVCADLVGGIEVTLSEKE